MLPNTAATGHRGTRAPDPWQVQTEACCQCETYTGFSGLSMKKEVFTLFYTDYILKQHFCTYWVNAELISSVSFKNVASGKFKVSCVAHIQFLWRVQRWNAPFLNGKLSEACLPVMYTPWTWSVSGLQHKGAPLGKALISGLTNKVTET